MDSEHAVVVEADEIGAGSQASPDWWRWGRASREQRRLLADMRTVELALARRTQVLKGAAEALFATGLYDRVRDGDRVRSIAVADLFVEKAQQVLTERSRRMRFRAEAATVAIVALMSAAAVFVGKLILDGRTEELNLSSNDLIFRLAQSLSLGAFGLVAVKLLTSLARAFFHESTKLLDRRHAMRFGRLYVHLNAHRLDSDDEVFDADQLAKAFDWNIDAPSAFLEVNPAAVSKTVWNQLAEAAGDSMPKEALAELVRGAAARR